jgi:hypothetical protein
MIKATELRIGNLILFDGKITHANSRNIAYINNSNRLKNRDSIAFEPVKFTEEWLKKAGYKKQNGYGYSNHNIYGLILKNDTGFEFHYYGIIIRIDFVHELQNLYFALTGEELILK